MSYSDYLINNTQLKNIWLIHHQSKFNEHENNNNYYTFNNTRNY